MNQHEDESATLFISTAICCGLKFCCYNTHFFLRPKADILLLGPEKNKYFPQINRREIQKCSNGNLQKFVEIERKPVCLVSLSYHQLVNSLTAIFAMEQRLYDAEVLVYR